MLAAVADGHQLVTRAMSVLTRALRRSLEQRREGWSKEGKGRARKIEGINAQKGRIHRGGHRDTVCVRRLLGEGTV